MPRLINADALIDFIDVGHYRAPTEICFSELMVKNIVDMMPTVDAEPVRHAYLMDPNPCGICSVCGYLIDIRQEFKYCPNCGAKMEGVKMDTERKEE